MNKSLILSVLFAIAGSAMAGDAKYPATNVEPTKTRAEVKAELAKWLADPAAQKAHKELYKGGSK